MQLQPAAVHLYLAGLCGSQERLLLLCCVILFNNDLKRLKLQVIYYAILQHKEPLEIVVRSNVCN